ncbi:MAG: DNA mismatch repair endonuclease MutL, partial [Ruminococcus sp.]|nr:DNA mismatch repair endonuclease MutL [Ruminococcus sp.]
MGVINVLDKHVAELIAAGEVVERPASVIKELVENAIDAGAKHITVEIKNGGTTFMRVTDDGCGFLREDVKLAFLRHATSKVREQDDLDHIATLGFRGEALASISAVSRLQLITKSAKEDTGTSYIIEGGEEKSFDDAGCPVGTTFVIRDLFYNIPARAKFLKKDVSEGNTVSNVVDKTALSHPEIAFTFVRDGKQALKTFGDGKLLSAIYAVFGREFATSLIPVDYQLDGITVSGYVSKPVNSRPNRNMQNFFINGRYVKSRTAMAALEEAFKGSIMVGKFPSCVLNLSLPFEAIDVNVHPSKIEVRFINERPVFDAVYHAAKSALLRHDDRKQAHFKDDSALREIRRSSTFNNAQAVFRKPGPPKVQPQIKPKDEFNPFSDIEFSKPNPKPKLQSLDDLHLTDKKKPFDVYSKQAVKNTKREESYSKPRNQPLPLIQKPDTPKPAVIADKPKAEEIVVTEKPNSEPVVLYEQQKDELKYVGELFDTYIIVEKNQYEMLLIDKHAAHERIIYEKLKAEKAGSSAQLLLTPITVTLGKSEYDAAINHLDMFSDCSFEVEDFGNSTLLVRSAPQYIEAAEVADCITEMADYISMGKNDIFTEKMDWFYHNVACRSAIKAGHKNSAQELIDIVKTLEENPQIRYCP